MAMNKKYQNIEINEAVIMAYINGELTSSEIKIVEQWLAESEINQSTLNEYQKTWKATKNLEPKPIAVNTTVAWEKVLSKIDTTPVVAIEKKNNYLKLVIGIAASIVLIIAMFNFWNKPIETMQLMATTAVIEKTLEDGSSITIDKNSEIIYPKNFGKTERKVKLEGAAFFEVKRDENRPFTIELPENSFVKVLGTSFTINTNAINNTTTVFVKTGKVEFGNSTNQLILLPNEKGIFNKNNGTFTKEVALKQKLLELYWIDEKLNFEGEKLGDIIDILSQVFDTEINLECINAANYPIVSDHDHDSLDKILEVVCLVHNLKINTEIVNGKTIYSIECND